jgi:hypothetical protein
MKIQHTPRDMIIVYEHEVYYISNIHNFLLRWPNNFNRSPKEILVVNSACSGWKFKCFSNINSRDIAHRNFSFASAEEVYQHLHVEPGCITPFVFLSEAVSKDIVVAISRELMFEKHLNFHPLHAEFTTRISFGLLLKLFGHLKRSFWRYISLFL